ncbi:transglycosylase domain-containing protein [Paenibacillus terrigena]|uniref:transglycosylase domain-containing protein n=1 Tax=Paenibacillus terrigena TaxID=369333 RepID=UPI0003AAFA3E|nr:PBP1A family penicillin-binding protein [Paenibacillus terrigena]
MSRHQARKSESHAAHAKSKPSRRVRLLKRLGAAALFLFLLLLIGTGGLLIYLRADSLPVSSMGIASKFVDREGQIIGYFQPQSGISRRPVGLSNIAPDLIHATLSVEDRHFYNHIGFDIKGMARAALVNIEHLETKQGASTLTQQLARNLYLSHERTWTRKAKEAMYTIQLEMNLSKDEILNQYLNNIYYGHGAYGIEPAAELYYGKPAKSLTLAESAMLAGIPKGPKYYSPFRDMKNAKDRQRTVLLAMVECGYITKQQADTAYHEILKFKPLETPQEGEIAPYFRDYIRNVVTDRLGFDESLLAEGGITVYTTLDLQAQQAAEQAIAKQIPEGSDLQAALVSIDPRSGYVKAMVGGTHYKTNQFNRVFAKTRQPGSAFKPIMYLAALESNQMTSMSRFKSEPTLFHYDENRKTYEPSNYGGKYFGEIDMRRAIAVSDNIYAVNTIMKIDPLNVVEMARKMGIDSLLKPLPSLALGTFPISPFEMASAYAVISNQGERVEPIAVLRIADAKGNSIYEAPTPQHTQVTDAAHTYVLTNLLESVFDTGGTGNRVSSLMKRPVAGKTGTTDNDAWLVGYTPELSTAVWVGYDRGKMIHAVDAHKAAPIFAQFTEEALRNVPPKIFPIPEGVVNVYIDPQTGQLATTACPDKRLEAFVVGTEPTESCSVHHGEETKQEGTESSPQHRSWWQDVKRWWTG